MAGTDVIILRIHIREKNGQNVDKKYGHLIRKKLL
jgi:hypothetical protein